jgi:signal transduction histidine kinase
LTKSLIELHGWRIDFASELGCGTTVTVTMPDAAIPLTAADELQVTPQPDLVA